MAHRALRGFTTGAGPVIAMVLVILASLTLMSEATQGSARFGQLYSVLLIINALGLLTLAGLIGWNLFQLLAQVRRRMAGARLTVRMVTMFVVLAVTPVLVVYYFSLQFLHRGIDSWFDVRVEKALNDSLELSRTALGVRMRELLTQTEVLAGELAVVHEDTAASKLEDARLLSGAAELTLMTSKGQPIVSSSADPMAIVPNRPDDAILLQVRQSRNYIGLDPIGDAGLHVRVVARIPDAASGTEVRILQGLFPVPERMNTLADTVQSAYAQYRELAYLRKPLKTSFTLTLSLVLLLSILTAVWAAFHSARRMVSPLRDVVQGTQAVAGGDYGTRLPPSGQDEIGFLVESFNEMTRKLARAQDETRQSQQQVEEQRRYLEAVLARLSSGVVTLDHEHRLFTANMAAAQILRVDLESEAGKTLSTIGETYPNVQPLTETVCAHLSKSTGDWREQVILFGPAGRQVLVCRGTPLPGSDHPQPGHVIVFDDLTELIQAQRNAAWSEVARRLAHEIKNPLTPIQLSAERLRHKYLNKLEGTDAAGLDRLTRTIVHQVEGMKEMVNAFSDYARNPTAAPKLVDLNELINDVLALYAAEGAGQAIHLHLDPELPPVEADPGRLRQVLHNLVKNALEASGSRAELAVATRCVRESAGLSIEVRIADRGVGFSEHILEHAFEPYATTKPGGTGLGLAIVKKIVEEHGGVVWAENNPQGGAIVIIRLPVLAARSPHTTTIPRREAV